MFYYILLFFVLTSVTTRKKDCEGKKIEELELANQS